MAMNSEQYSRLKAVYFADGNLVIFDNGQWKDVESGELVPGTKGPKGDRGPAGPQGPKGPKGDRGARGLQGLRGERGVKGDPGTAIQIKGTVDKIEDLELLENVELSDTYICADDAHAYMYNGEGIWIDCGRLRGAEGPKGEKGDKGEQGEKGDSFTFEDLTAEQVELLRGPRGFQGERGIQGEPGIAGEKGEQGEQGEQGPAGEVGPQGPQGEKGEGFKFEDLTDEQKEELRGPEGRRGPQGLKGDDLVFDDLTDEQKEELRGPKGDPLRFEDLTQEQINELRSDIAGPEGPQGPAGEAGPQGEKGEKGDAGEQGPQGEVGPQGPQGEQGIQGPAGEKGADGKDGKSAYEIAVEKGFEGDEEAWLAAMKYDDSALKELVKDELPFRLDYSAKTIIFYACGFPVVVEKNTAHKYDAEAAEDAVILSYHHKAQSVHEVFTAEEAAKLIIYGGYSNKTSKIHTMRVIPETSITVKGVDIKAVVGGSDYEGLVGKVKIDLEDCNLSYVHGAGFAGESVESVWPDKNIVYDLDMKLTNVGCESVFPGPNGYGVLVNGKVVVDGKNTHIQLMSIGGSNGMTRRCEAVIKAGTIDLLQSVNRGVVDDSVVTLEGGTVTKFYVGGETTDETVTGIVRNPIIHLQGGTVTNLEFGKSNSIELTSMKGTVTADVVIGNKSAEETGLTLVAKPEGQLNDMTFMDGKPVWFNGTDWVDANGVVCNYPTQF